MYFLTVSSFRGRNQSTLPFVSCPSRLVLCLQRSPLGSRDCSTCVRSYVDSSACNRQRCVSICSSASLFVFPGGEDAERLGRQAQFRTDFRIRLPNLRFLRSFRCQLALIAGTSLFRPPSNIASSALSSGSSVISSDSSDTSDSMLFSTFARSSIAPTCISPALSIEWTSVCCEFARGGRPALSCVDRGDFGAGCRAGRLASCNVSGTSARRRDSMRCCAPRPGMMSSEKTSPAAERTAGFCPCPWLPRKNCGKSCRVLISGALVLRLRT